MVVDAWLAWLIGVGDNIVGFSWRKGEVTPLLWCDAAQDAWECNPEAVDFAAADNSMLWLGCQQKRDVVAFAHH